MQITIMLDNDVIEEVERRAAKARLGRSAWLNQFLALSLFGDDTLKSEAAEPVSPPAKRRSRLGGRR
jgi:hypothetical protein